ncbi:SDR family NAD(P)-dependent oxidoreductase [Leucobacter chironomi]|uniref:SDR family NAD(P)-dependent oxidoreductase n=1 Tax=Leucobacter chironomi TaxID=491918 RepID=UPI0004126832|nr:SDR family NAD(P)-dependent oxidoreductase [Leucobacter chironomi]
MDFNRTLPRKVIVTGAQSGIGRAVSEAVIASGGRVLGIDRTAGAWKSDGFTAHTADITDADQVTKVFEEAQHILGGSPDAVVHCAGIYRHSAIESTSLDEWNLSMTVNSTGSFLVSQAASRVMESGAIVLLTSVAYARGDRLEPCSPYAASKGAVVSLTQQLAAELGPRGIRVNAVAPGVIHTPMTTIVENAEATAALEDRLSLQRLGEADEVAAACLFLASGAASYITGTVLPVDGGYLIS